MSIESRGMQIDICKNSWEHGWSVCNYGNSNFPTPRLTDKKCFIDVGERWGLKLKKTQNYSNWSSKGDTKEIQQTRNNDTYIVTITQKLGTKVWDIENKRS